MIVVGRSKHSAKKEQSHFTKHRVTLEKYSKESGKKKKKIMFDS